MRKMKTKTICILGVGIALYTALSMIVKVPLIGHIQTDLGYAAYGAYLAIFGMIGTIVGACGCVIESLIYASWFPFGWLLGQIFIGVTCGYVFKKANAIANSKVRIAVYVAASTISVFIGVGLIKTVVECAIWSLPFQVKLVKNCIAFLADTPPMIVGVLVGDKLKRKGIIKESD